MKRKSGLMEKIIVAAALITVLCASLVGCGFDERGEETDRFDAFDCAREAWSRVEFGQLTLELSKDGVLLYRYDRGAVDDPYGLNPHIPDRVNGESKIAFARSDFAAIQIEELQDGVARLDATAANPYALIGTFAVQAEMTALVDTVGRKAIELKLSWGSENGYTGEIVWEEDRSQPNGLSANRDCAAPLTNERLQVKI